MATKREWKQYAASNGLTCYFVFVFFLFLAFNALVEAILEHLVYYYYLLFLCLIFLYWRLKWYRVTFLLLFCISS